MPVRRRAADCATVPVARAPIIIRGQDRTAFLLDGLRAGATLKTLGAALGVSKEYIWFSLRRVGLRSRARQLRRVQRRYRQFLASGFYPAQQVVANWASARDIAVEIVPTKERYSCALLRLGASRVLVCCHGASSPRQMNPTGGRYFYAQTCARPSRYACYVVSPERIYCLPRWTIRKYQSKVYFPER